MSLTCRQPGHIPHIWPPLPLSQNHMIFSCEQFCQWCPVVAKDLKRWETAANLRKHAKCHITKDSPFTIETAGKGGRTHIAIQNSLIDTKALYEVRVQEAATSSIFAHRLSTGDLIIDLKERSPSPADQSATGPELETRHTSPQAPPMPDQLKTGSIPHGQVSAEVPAGLASPPPVIPAGNQSTTSPTLDGQVPAEIPAGLASPPPVIPAGNQSTTSSIPDGQVPAGMPAEVPTSLASSPPATSGIPVADQSTTGVQHILKRRRRKATLSTSSRTLRSAKRTK